MFDLENYFKTSADEVNKKYFLSLYKQVEAETSIMKIFHPVDAPDSKVFPYPLLDEKSLMPVTAYSELDEAIPIKCKVRLIKMNAGIGSSVKRIDHLMKNTLRKKMGSKSTDLFWEGKSLAQLTLKQVKTLAKSPLCHSICLQNLVNEETKDIIQKEMPRDELVEVSIEQFKMPTLNEKLEITTERLAPGGHAFLGFYLLSTIYKTNDYDNEIIAIGNGEDLNSTPDEKIFSWMEKSKTPICMVTTTKTSKDKKGGQLAIVKEKIPYLTIIEKAQAEQAGQMAYFEEIGLEQGEQSFFNTNIVLINTKIFKKILIDNFTSLNELEQVISPDLIKNKKIQEGKVFYQLEGAIASVLLNLDRYLRQKSIKVVKLLNLEESERELFFMPIKKWEDFVNITENYYFDELQGRILKK